MEYGNQTCPVVGIEGFAASGKQFDLDITIPEDQRDVIYGVIRDCYKNPVKDAVVKLIEVEKGCRENRKPVSHTFTDKHGEFVFGPLCPNKCYTIEIWANRVEHVKICAKCNREGKCLKGIDLGPCDHFMGNDCCDLQKPCWKEEYRKECKKDDKVDYKDDYKENCKPDYKPECKPDHKDGKKNCKLCCELDHKEYYKPNKPCYR